MPKGLKEQLIDMLEHDAAIAHERAQAWKELQGHGTLLDKEEKPVSTAADMLTKFAEDEAEIRDLIAKIKAM
jgi:hypothetical protein